MEISRGEMLLLTLMLGLLVATEAFTIDSSLPAMPAIAAGLGATDAAVQISLGVFMLGMAVGQLIHGPLSDGFGRKPVLVLAMGLYTLATVGCIFAPDIETLTALRLVQGFGAACGHTLSRAIVRDRFDREHAARLYSYILVVLAVAPIAAPILGAHFTIWFGWRSLFVMLTLYGVAVILLNGLFLRETNTSPDKAALNPGRILLGFAEVARNRIFWGYLVCNAAAFAGLFAFLSGSSSVLISYLGVAADSYGYYFALTMVGHMAALFWGGWAVGRYGLDALLRIGVVLAAASGVLMGTLAWSGVVSVAAIVGPAFLFMCAFALIVPQAVAGALSPFPHIAGAASSLMGFLQLGTGSVTGALVGYFYDGTQLPMTTAIFAAGLFGLAGYLIVLPRGQVRSR